LQVSFDRGFIGEKGDRASCVEEEDVLALLELLPLCHVDHSRCRGSCVDGVNKYALRLGEGFDSVDLLLI